MRFFITDNLTMRQLKSDFKQIKRLRGMSGFGWDDGRKLVIAADEQWAELAKVCLRMVCSSGFMLIPIAEGFADPKVEEDTFSNVR